MNDVNFANKHPAIFKRWVYIIYYASIMVEEKKLQKCSFFGRTYRIRTGDLRPVKAAL